MTEMVHTKPRFSITRRITYGAVLLALTLALPQLFHFVGGGQAGAVFLPMHIPVLLGGLVLGPVFGLGIGAFAPILSYAVTGMPMAARLPFMIIELAAYGFASGLFYQIFGLHKKWIGVYAALIGAMLIGRLVYALSIILAGSFFGFVNMRLQAVIAATITGLIGIVVQLIIIPPIVLALKKGGQLDGFIRNREQLK